MTYRVQCTLPHDSGVPSDVTVNVFHTLPGTPDLPALVTSFVTFYEQIEEYLSTVLAGNVIIRVYDLDDPEPREPLVEVDTGPVFEPTTPTLPEECAVALSIAAEPASGVPAARRRGRVFLGPLSSAASEFSAATGHTVPVAARNALVGAGSDLVTSTLAAGSRLAVYSRVDGLSRAVRFVSMDDALDTIRSRGHRPTVRTTIGPIV